MKKQNRKTGATGTKVFGALVGVSVALPFQALAELVYEGSPQASASLEGAPVSRVAAPVSEDLSPANTRIAGERESLRQAVRASERIQATTAAAPAPVAPVAIVTTPQVQVAPAALSQVSQAPVAPAVEVEHVSRSELMRRERVRHELRNEDLLQERLEELRLRDEKKRSDELFSGGLNGSVQAAPIQPVAQAAPLREEVLSPHVEALPPVAAVPAAPAAALTAPVKGVGQSSSSTTTIPAEARYESVGSEERPVMLSVAPRAGLSTMSGVAGLSVQSRYTAGLAFGVGVTDNLGFELGYSYSEFGVALASSNPWVYNFQAWTGTREPIALKQNVIDAGLKLHFLGPESRLRPFILAGGAYGKGFINYDARIIDALAQSGFSSMAYDYEVSSFMGYLGTGLDLRLSKAVSIGAQFKYFTVLSARENQSLNQAALSGYAPGGLGYGYPVVPSYGTVYGADMDKQVLGGTLARASFYSITAGVSFTF